MRHTLTNLRTIELCESNVSNYHIVVVANVTVVFTFPTADSPRYMTLAGQSRNRSTGVMVAAGGPGSYQEERA